MSYLSRKNSPAPAICSKRWACVKKFLVAGSIIAIIWGCQRPAVPVDTLQPPEYITTADKKFAGVFKMLDGQWRGTFYIYEDPSYLQRQGANRNVAADFSPRQAGFIPVDSIAVHQSYRSESPYYQIVRIEDTYTSADGKQRRMISLGINKVQQGGIWCVVQKSDETVVHRGELLDSQTIIWSREKQEPQRIEWFRETVTDSMYTIIGWGYYSGDDPQAGPPLWFSATYKKQGGNSADE